MANSISSKLRRNPRLVVVALLTALGLLSGSNAFCQNAHSEPLSIAEVQERLNGAGYAPLWQIQQHASGYTVEGIDPEGNPVVLSVDSFNADIIALESLALLR